MIGLGKINVLCGPNNSGKTTVLECIGDDKLHSVGTFLEPQVAKRIETSLMQGQQWKNSHFAKQFAKLTTETLATEPVWFADEGKKFFEGLLTRWQQEFGNSSPGDRNRLIQAFEDEFSKPHRVLLPAKRKLETFKVVSSFEPIKPDGTGLLNFLFAAKNQEEASGLRAQFNAICEAFREISAGYEFDVHIHAKPQGRHPPDTIVELKFRRQNGQWIDADNCGLGLHELIIILHYAIDPENEVILVEEAENHLHPEIQRRLIRFLRDGTEKQFFLSTHSSVFLNTQYADRIFSCKMADDVEVVNATSRASLLTELGYSIAENLVSDLIVLCEGPKDKPFLDEFFQKYGLLDYYSIKVWPLGGDIMDQLDLSVFQQSHRLIALIDSDPVSGHIRKRFVKKCSQLQISVTVLERYSLENYFSLPAIASVMNQAVPPVLDPQKKVSEQLGFDVKRNSGEIARAMKLEDIAGTDLEKFFMLVKSSLTTEIK